MRRGGAEDGLDLREAPAPERRLEELRDARLELPRPRVVDGPERRLDLAERLELAEELDVAERRAAGEDLPDPVHLAGERLEDGLHDPLQDRGLVLVVPDVLEDEEVRRVRDVAAVEVRAGGEELEHLDHAAVREAHALGADLEDEALVG